jgi:diaminopimelate epimerase
MTTPFCKYHGLGNDFILIDDRNDEILPELTESRIIRLCHRHEGIGADGMLVRTSSSRADHRMLLFNADGSPAEISGNGLRCFVLFLKRQGYPLDGGITVETGGGVMRARVIEERTVETTMPSPDFAKGKAPKSLRLIAEDKSFTVIPVNVGNPHGVIFGPARDIEFARKYGPPLEKNSAFPEGANIEFVRAVSDTECGLVVWERGAGITLACGSGSVATACAGCAIGEFQFDTPITVKQPGGSLQITVAKNFKEIRQRGVAQFVFEGEIELNV